MKNIMEIGPFENKPAVAGDRAGTARSSLDESPEAAEMLHAEKVQRIARAIREGRFRADPEAIADKLIANAQELLESRSH